jgi:hypothetical protein
MGGTVTVWALHLPEGAAWQAQRVVGMVACHASQKVTAPEFPVTSAPWSLSFGVWNLGPGWRTMMQAKCF